MVKDYKDTMSALERELRDARADPVIAVDVEAKQRLLAQLEQERTAKEEAEKGSSHTLIFPSPSCKSHRRASALLEAETESEKQPERIEELEQTLFQLQDEIGARRRLPPDVRVLSLRDNPVQQ